MSRFTWKRFLLRTKLAFQQLPIIKKKLKLWKIKEIIEKKNRKNQHSEKMITETWPCSEEMLIRKFLVY